MRSLSVQDGVGVLPPRLLSPLLLVGKGVAALQEAGWVSQALVHAPRIEWLGLYPSWQSLLAQVAVAVAAIVGFVVNTRSVPAPAKRP